MRAGLQEYLSLLSFVKFTVGVLSLRGPGPDKGQWSRVVMARKLPVAAPSENSHTTSVGISMYLTRLLLIAS